VLELDGVWLDEQGLLEGLETFLVSAALEGGGLSGLVRQAPGWEERVLGREFEGGSEIPSTRTRARVASGGMRAAKAVAS
jgi:hypothetical protein